MSSVCIFNIVDEISDYNKLNYIARELMQTAINNNLGISFFSTYYDGLIDLPQIKNYFLLSDSFIYRHCNELISTNEFWQDGSASSFKKNFISHFKFFDILLNKLFGLGIENIEIYFADVDEPIESLKEFKVVRTNYSNFVNDLLNVVLEEMNEWGGTIPTSLKFELTKIN